MKINGRGVLDVLLRHFIVGLRSPEKSGVRIARPIYGASAFRI
jgi:hypothetical protein